MMLTGLVVVAAGAVGWRFYLMGSDNAASPADVSSADGAPADLASARELPLVIEVPDDALRWSDHDEAAPADTGEDEVLEPEGPSSAAEADVDRPAITPEPEPDLEKGGTDNAAIEAARRQFAAGQVIEARQALNTLLPRRLSQTDQAEVRRLLTTIADETIFARRRLPGDPLVDAYKVRSGDVLIHIGRDHKVPPEVLMRINGIRDATKLRADETIKVLRGPFHARIYKSAFRLDVYLQDLYVRSFRVGLGSEQATPEGVWRVKERLPNPTYYPPPSAQNKRIIPADDPKNPLGEHWIGLEGIKGEALGHYGYGIHGTIEPESIGRAVSLGCVRMHNEDVAFLYALLQPGQSTVTILP